MLAEGDTIGLLAKFPNPPKDQATSTAKPMDAHATTPAAHPGAANDPDIKHHNLHKKTMD